MEFNEKLQELRKQKGLTQEALAEKLYVSRTAISKWESGRGCPSIDSLKALSAFFSISIDDLLSGDELLTIAEENARQQKAYFQGLVFGMLDCSVILFFFLPFFGQTAGGVITSVSLLSLTGISPWLKTAYFAFVTVIAVWGLLTLGLQACQNRVWKSRSCSISLVLNAAAVLLFIASLQPYAAAFLFILMAIKAVMLIKIQ